LILLMQGETIKLTKC